MTVSTVVLQVSNKPPKLVVNEYDGRFDAILHIYGSPVPYWDWCDEVGIHAQWDQQQRLGISKPSFMPEVTGVCLGYFIGINRNELLELKLRLP